MKPNLIIVDMQPKFDASEIVKNAVLNLLTTAIEDYASVIVVEYEAWSDTAGTQPKDTHPAILNASSNAAANLCSVAIVGDVFPRSIRLIVFTDTPLNSDKARNVYARLFRNALNLLLTVMEGESSMVHSSKCSRVCCATNTTIP